jgi:two-component system, response regulator YesN
MATDGAEAVELVQQTTVDVLVPDLSMPNMTGMEALHRTRAVAPDVRIVVLSVYLPALYGQAAVNAGATLYLEKDGRLDGSSMQCAPQPAAILRTTCSKRCGHRSGA